MVADTLNSAVRWHWPRCASMGAPSVAVGRLDAVCLASLADQSPETLAPLGRALTRLRTADEVRELLK